MKTNILKVGETYTDQYNNKVMIICGDYTGLNRGIVYGQFIDRVNKPCTPKEFENAMKQNRFIACTFAIWDFDFDKYTPIKTNTVIDKTKLPNVSLYSKYLNIASMRFRLSMDECRDKYGLFTINQWETLLQN